MDGENWTENMVLSLPWLARLAPSCLVTSPNITFLYRTAMDLSISLGFLWQIFAWAIKVHSKYLKPTVRQLRVSRHFAQNKVTLNRLVHQAMPWSQGCKKWWYFWILCLIMEHFCEHYVVPQFCFFVSEACSGTFVEVPQALDGRNPNCQIRIWRGNYAGIVSQAYVLFFRVGMCWIQVRLRFPMKRANVLVSRNAGVLVPPKCHCFGVKQCDVWAILKTAACNNRRNKGLHGALLIGPAHSLLSGARLCAEQSALCLDAWSSLSAYSCDASCSYKSRFSNQHP